METIFTELGEMDIELIWDDKIVNDEPGLLDCIISN